MASTSGKATATKYPEKEAQILASLNKENADLKASNAALIKAANITAGGDRRLFADEGEVEGRELRRGGGGSRGGSRGSRSYSRGSRGSRSSRRSSYGGRGYSSYGRYGYYGWGGSYGVIIVGG